MTKRYMIAFSSYTPYLVETTYNFTSKIHKFDTEFSQTISNLKDKFSYQNKRKTFANPRKLIKVGDFVELGHIFQI